MQPSLLVQIDCHVDVERHRYSMRHSLVGQTLEARITTVGLGVTSKWSIWYVASAELTVTEGQRGTCVVQQVNLGHVAGRDSSGIDAVKVQAS